MQSFPRREAWTWRSRYLTAPAGHVQSLMFSVCNHVAILAVCPGRSAGTAARFALALPPAAVLPCAP
jgi:hypothetical protein